MRREAALTRLRFNLARPWFQRRFTHRGRNVINAVAGNIPSAAEAPGLGEGAQAGGPWSGYQGGQDTAPGSPSHVSCAPSSPTAVSLRGKSPREVPLLHKLNCSAAVVSSAWKRAPPCQLHLWLCY